MCTCVVTIVCVRTFRQYLEKGDFNMISKNDGMVQIEWQSFRKPTSGLSKAGCSEQLSPREGVGG